MRRFTPPDRTVDPGFGKLLACPGCLLVPGAPEWRCQPAVFFWRMLFGLRQIFGMVVSSRNSAL